MPKTHRKNTRKPAKGRSLSSTLSEVKFRISRSKTPYREAARIRLELPISQIPDIVKRLGQDPKYCQYIVGVPFRHKVSDFTDETIFVDDDLPRLLIWISSVLVLFSAEISNFLEKRERFGHQLLVGDHDLAEKLLGNIERDCGITLWSLDNRINLIQTKYGIERQKDFTTDFASNCKDGTVARIALSCSARVEPHITSKLFCSEVNAMISELRSGNAIPASEYLLFRLDPYSDSAARDYSLILSYDSNSSIVDRYLLFIEIAQSLALKTRDDLLNRRLIRALEMLGSRIADSRINTILYLLGKGKEIHFNGISRSFLTVLDSYTSGDYARAATEAATFIKSNPAVIEAYAIYAKANLRAGADIACNAPDGSASSTILKYMDVLYKDRREFSSARESLIKLCYIYQSHNWSREIYRFVMRECDSCPGSPMGFHEKLALLNSSVVNPQLVNLIPDAKRRLKLFQSTQSECGESITVSLIKACESSDLSILNGLEIDSYRSKKYKAQILERRGKHSMAAEIYRELTHSPDAAISIEAELSLIRVLLTLNELEECMFIGASLLIDDSNYFNRIPVKEILAAASRDKTGAFKGNIALPILYDFYCRNSESAQDSKKVEAYEDFLIARRLQRPSEMRRHISDFDQNMLTYFLRFICVSKVMDVSPEFTGGSEEVETERIAVCQLLSEADQSNQDLYIQEIEDIVNNIALSKQAHLVERNKIYVDVVQLKSAALLKLDDQFKRFMSLPESSDQDTEFITGNVEGVDFATPSDAKGHSLFAMYKYITREFAQNPQHGLDVALSAEIRHGNFATHFRSPLEIAHLVTRIGRDRKYEDNKYWAKRYDYVNEKIIDALNERLKRFSREIDEIIALVKDAWIQVEVDINPATQSSEKLFDFKVSADEISLIRSLITPNSTPEEFVDLCFDRLWKITDDCLVVAQRRIREDLLGKVLSMFDALTNDIRRIKGTAQLQELEEATLGAKSGVQREIELIAGWFSRSVETNVQDFEIGVPISITKNIVEKTYRQHRVNIDVDLRANGLIKGCFLKPLTTIFMMLFSNAVEHCDLEDIINIKVDVEGAGCILKIAVSNPVSSNIDAEAVHQRLADIRDKLREGKYREYVRREGGSGFFKIFKIIREDMALDTVLTFDLNEDRIFTVSLELNKIGE